MPAETSFVATCPRCGARVFARIRNNKWAFEHHTLPRTVAATKAQMQALVCKGSGSNVAKDEVPL